MSTTEERLVAVVQAISGDIKALSAQNGDLTTLKTAQKLTLVGAINSLFDALLEIDTGPPSEGGSSINDNAGTGNLTVTWSADKIVSSIAAATLALKNSILGGASAAFDTLKELQDALGSDQSFATTIATGLNSRVRFDAAQSLTELEQTQARSNIDAGSKAILDALIIAVGNTDRDLVAAYNDALTADAVFDDQLAILAESVDDRIGDLMSLETEVKFNLVDAINSLLQKIPKPEIGELRYFFEGSNNRGWLACNGIALDRDDYPDYEAKRPDPAYVVDIIQDEDPGDFQFFIKTWPLSNGNIIYASTITDFKLSTDQLVTGTTLNIGESTPFKAFGQMPNGRVVCVNWATTDIHYSDDFGVNWVKIVSVAAPTSPLPQLTIVDLSTCISDSGEMRIPVIGTDKVLSTSDGLTWTIITATILSSNSASKFEQIVGGFTIPTTTVTNTVYYFGANGGIIYNIADTFVSSSIDSMSRPSGVQAHVVVNGVSYETMVGIPGLFVVDKKANISNFGAAGSSELSITGLSSIGNKLIGIGGTKGVASRKMFWISPGGKNLEFGNLMPESAPVSTSYSGVNSVFHKFADRTVICTTVEVDEGGGVYSNNNYKLVCYNDVTKFNAPGLSDFNGVKPYVFVGNSPQREYGEAN